MDLTFFLGHDRFNIRVSAVVIARDQVLLQGSVGYPFFVPPGGRCALHESTREAAARELREELGRVVAVGRLLWLIESFFPLDGFAVHELTFVYEAALPHGDSLVDREGDFPGADGDPGIFFRWVPLARLAALEIYPQVLRTRCADLPQETEHLVVRG
jgi:8-oxo-dGTP pyrophosphatase MutT (NUDIX family)